MKKLLSTLALATMLTTATAQLPDVVIPELQTISNGQTAPECKKNPQKILDHIVVLEDQRLQPWTSYDTVLTYSMNYLKNCPTKEAADGILPYYLVTARVAENGEYNSCGNNQGSNLYFGMEMFKRYYAYTGDLEGFKPIELLAKQIIKYHTPADYAWPNVPRTQDDSPDGVYDDDKGEPDKACMVAIAYIDLARFTGDKQYLRLAEGIAKTLLPHIKEGNAKESPLPFRVNMKTGEVMDAYTSNMIMVVKMIDELLAEKTSLSSKELKAKKQILMNWIMTYPMENNLWSGYFEDVHTEEASYANINQVIPLETARYLMLHPELDPLYKEHVRKLIYLVKYRFGFVKRYGATSICEQDLCFAEMSSHTARYAGVVAHWFGLTGDEAAREEARASFALSTYSAYNKYSKDGNAINYTGIGYLMPWFSDSYFDFIPHFYEGFEEMPEMIEEGTPHLFYTSSLITKISYKSERIAYTALSKEGTERVKLTYTPVVYADGKPLPQNQWSFGQFRGVNNILTIHRKGAKNIEIRKK